MKQVDPSSNFGPTLILLNSFYLLHNLNKSSYYKVNCCPMGGGSKALADHVN